MDGAAREVADRLAELNVAYQEKFGHVFLICASGLPAEVMLRALEHRLRNDAAAERLATRAELTAITRLRLERLLAAGAQAERVGASGAEAQRVGAREPVHARTGRGTGRAGGWDAGAAVPRERSLGRAATDADGRIRDAFPQLEAGVYRLVFETGALLRRARDRVFLSGGRGLFRGRGPGAALPRTAAAESVRLFDLPRELEVDADHLGREPLRQGRDARRAHHEGRPEPWNQGPDGERGAVR